MGFSNHVVFKLQLSFGYSAVFVRGLLILGNALASSVFQDLLLDAANVVLKICHDLFAFFHLVFHDFGVLHLELFVLLTILAGDHFKLLADQIRPVVTVGNLKLLIVKK